MKDRGNILIVDDVPENLQLLSRLLGERQYKVRALPNAKLAIQSVYTHPPDLILLDISMPDIDGFELCKILKNNEASSDIPVIFISGHHDTESILKGFEMGGVDYITKPFKSEEVYARIETQLKLKRRTSELEELLSKTLRGSIQTILDILAFVDPEAYHKSNLFSKAMDELTEAFILQDTWQFHLAALLSTLGTFSITKYEVDKSHTINSRSDEIETAAYLISKIPRLEGVTTMIEESKNQSEMTRDFFELEATQQGGVLLKIINDIYELLKRDENPEEIKKQVITNYKHLNERMINKIFEVLIKKSEETYEWVKLYQLKPGMVLAESISTVTNIKLIAEGTELSENIIHLLKKRLYFEEITEPIKVFM